MKIKHVIIAVCVALTVGFFLGRATVNRGEIVRLVPGKAVRTPVPVPVPEAKVVYIPTAYQLPTKTDTINNTFVQVVDTAAIIREYITIRDYSVNLFDNENGKLELQQRLQYNQLQSLSYTFRPIIREVKIKQEKRFVPFLGASWITSGNVGISGGFFLNSLGIEYTYLHDYISSSRSHQVGVKCRF